MQSRPSKSQPKQRTQAGSWTSLVLTGDLRGLGYIKTAVKEIPDNAFNFCCTIDGSSRKEADLSGARRPWKPELAKEQWLSDRAKRE